MAFVGFLRGFSLFLFCLPGRCWPWRRQRKSTATPSWLDQVVFTFVCLSSEFCGRWWALLLFATDEGDAVVSVWIFVVVSLVFGFFLRRFLPERLWGLAHSTRSFWFNHLDGYARLLLHFFQSDRDSRFLLRFQRFLFVFVFVFLRLRCGVLCVLTESIGFYGVFSFVGAQFYGLLLLWQFVTGFYRVLPGFTRFYQVLLDFTRFNYRFYRVLPGFTGFYWVFLGFTGFCWVLLVFTGFRLR